MSNKILFITSIGTDSGKTVSSAILANALKADYWKPLQAGDEGGTDSERIGKWAPEVVVHKEAFRLKEPASPHQAARNEGIQIKAEEIQFPKTDNILLVEIAGGLMSPLNDELTYIDWIQKLNGEIIIIIPFYLGSINHSLLTLEVLEQRKIRVKGIIFNGKVNQDSLDFILKRNPFPILGYIPQIESITAETIHKVSNELDLHF